MRIKNNVWNKSILAKYQKEKNVFDFIECIFNLYVAKELAKLKNNIPKKDILNIIKDIYIKWINWQTDLWLTESNYKKIITKYNLNWESELYTQINWSLSTNAWIFKNLYKKAASRILIQESILICPICWINHLFWWINEYWISTATEIDHFYSRYDYPWLSLNPYNLILVCRTCNNTKSNNKYDKKINYPYCYLKDYNFSFLDKSLGIDLIKLSKDNWINNIYDIEKRYNNLNNLQFLYEKYLDNKIFLEITNSSILNIKKDMFLKNKNIYKESNSKFEADFIKFLLNIDK